MITSIGSLLKGLLYGAGAMYFLDPDRGRRRRAGVLDRGVHLAHEIEDLYRKGCRDLANRGLGAAAELRRTFASGPADDQLLVARVRAVLGHHVCDARGVEVSAANGTVTLRGAVRPGEPETLIPAIERISGVRGVESALTTEGAAVGPCAPPAGLRPGTRLLMTAGGGLLVANCLLRRGFVPSLLGTAGFGMLVRGIMDHAGRTTGLHRERGISIHRSLWIEAPVEKTFEFLADPAQSGRLLPGVANVERLAEGRVRWTVEGPAGVGRLSCDEQVVESIENERIVWASVPGAVIQYSSEARFARERDGTRLDVRLVYDPPGGTVARAAASLFGFDPKTLLDRSLNRIKQHLEEAVVAGGAADSTVKRHRG